MTSEEKKDIYTMLKKASCWAYGYDSPTFKDDDILFEDDVYEYIEPQEQIPQDAKSINQKPEKISTAEEEISKLEILANKISSVQPPEKVLSPIKTFHMPILFPARAKNPPFCKFLRARA